MSTLSSPDLRVERRAARRRMTPLGWAWLTIALVMALDIVGVRRMPHPVEFRGSPRMLCGYGALLLVGGWIAARTRAGGDASKWGKRLADLSFTTLWMGTFAVFCAAAAVLGYLSVAANFPLIDGALLRFDEAVGFDWVVWYRWVLHHRVIFGVLSAAYWSGVVQAIVVPSMLGATGRRREMIRHIARTMLATLFAISISTPLPAASAYLHFHVVEPGTASTVSGFFLLRHGTLSVFDLTNMQGLVSMPSMHVTMAILFAWALKGIPRLAAPAMVLNAMMMVSAPSQGGHYLADAATGVLLAGVTILLVAHMHIDA